MYNIDDGQCIYQSPSGYKVFENSNYRWLTLNSETLQTVINRQHPENPCSSYVIAIIKIISHFPGDCCLMGLGGGSVLHALSTSLDHDKLTVVEKNVEIIEIAERFFDLSRIQNLTIRHQSAEEFVKTNEFTFQNIIVDLHDAFQYPPECTTESFISHCKALLNPNGVFVINVLRIENHILLFALIRKQFNNATILFPIKNATNALIFAFNSSGYLKKIQNIPEIKQIHWDEFYGFVGEI